MVDNTNDAVVNDGQNQEGVDNRSTGNENENAENESKQNDSNNKRNTGSSFYKQKLTEYEQQLQELREANENLKTQSLQEKQNYKELWELEKQKRAETEQRLQQDSEMFWGSLKMNAIEKAALNAGIRKEALEDLNYFDSSIVEIEKTDRGNVNIIGAEDFIESLKAKKPYLFTQAIPPNVNNGGAGFSTPKQMDPKEILALKEKDPKKYQEVMQELIKKRYEK